MPNGEERPIAYASRTLSASEKNYAQIEKEALSLIFGVKKFHNYLYGRKFTLITDHKPLTAILGPKTSIPTLAAARMQRWALILSAHQYEIEYRSSSQHANADALSRLPNMSVPAKSEEAGIYHVSIVDQVPIRARDIEKATRNDYVLSRALDYTRNGWPSHISNPGDLRPFLYRKNELSVEQGCLLWGARVIIPSQLRNRVLSELHEGHPGMCRMKALARSFIWWPGLDQHIEDIVRQCSTCAAVRNMPVVSPLHSWKYPTRVWERVHIDYASFEGQNYFVLVDVYSKWPEVFNMSSTTSTSTINVLRSLFSRYGLPEELVSDNGPQFTSDEFTTFLLRNGVKHTRVAPYHAASNGAAERMVQVLKQNLKKSKVEKCSQQHRLSNFLFHQRTTPHSLTGCTPAELFLKRTLRTRLSLLKPNLASSIEEKQQHNGKVVRAFEPGDLVLVKNFRGKEVKWLSGVIVQRLGPVAYLVRIVHSNQIRHVHVDHIISSSTHVGESAPQQPSVSDDIQGTAESTTSMPDNAHLGMPETVAETVSTEMSTTVPQTLPETLPASPVATAPTTPVATSTVPVLRRSQRDRRPPSYMKDFVAKY